MTFASISTERLLLRPVTIDDAQALADRRSDPEVARYQNWSVPYPLERARALMDDVLAHPEPVSDGWWMLTVAEHDGTIVGDLAIHPTFDGRSVEIGYTLARSAWGRGYAVEAVTALVERLWEDPTVTRLSGMIHPDNVASAQVLERTGFIHEGRTRLSYWVGDDNSDDGLYGMTRDDWHAWTSRPRTPPDAVELVEIDDETFRDVGRLVSHDSQRRFVAPVLNSFANALFPPVQDDAAFEPWLRAVRADGDLVGFVMMASRTEAHPRPYLWRLLIDRLHQRRGIGSRVVDLVIEEARRQGGESLGVSWVDERGGPAPLYLGKGFVPTGDIDDGEVVARLAL